VPELPEVEVTRRSLAPHLEGQAVTEVVVRRHLRWPVPKNLPELLHGKVIRALGRRGKYLLVEFDHGMLILHLGMSGSLRLLPAGAPSEKHDHFDLVLGSGMLVRLRDPRRFGAVLWHEGGAGAHPLLAALGPEPLPDESGQCAFDARYLYRVTRNRRIAIKQLIMNSRVVVGVGNIYAGEALFRAGIPPQLAAGRLSLPRCARLVEEIRATLTEAIEKGGSSLRDFVDGAGRPGYFQQHYWVYGRGGEPCRKCGAPVRQIRQGQRSSFYCPQCQK